MKAGNSIACWERVRRTGGRRNAGAPPLRAYFLIAAGTAGWLGGTGSAQAFPLTDAATPSILAPSPDATGEPRDLTAQVGPSGPFSGVPSPGWTFTPRIGAQTSYNTNVLATRSDPRWDWVNYLSPGLTVQANTERLQAKFDYSPTLGIYARTPSLNFLGHNFIGNSSITFVPDLFYMDLRGIAGVQPRSGGGFGNSGVGSAGANANSTVGLPANQLTQAVSFGIAPYLLHRFGEYGTGKIGYSLSGSSIRPISGFGTFPFTGSSSSSSSSSPATTAQLNQSGLLNQNANLITNQQIAQFQSGEILGRFNNLTIASASQFTGSGAAQNGSQNFISNQLGYAVTRQVIVFGSIGYENIQYNGIPPTRINGATWQVGTTLTPNRDSKITIGYGHQNGINALLVDGSYQVTPRLRVSVSYNTGIGNGLSQLQNNVAASDIDQNGGLVNALTGAPLFNTSGLVGSNANLYRTKTFTGTASLSLDRDVIVASVSVSDQQLLATSVAGAGTAGSTSATTGQATWTHELRSSLTSIVSGTYTTQQSQSSFVPGTQTTINANLILQYQINPTLTATAQYAYYDRSSPISALSFTQNVILLGVSKTF